MLDLDIDKIKKIMKKIFKIQFWEKHKNLIHGFSTKMLGNISFRTGDRKTVSERRIVMAGELGIDWNNVLILPLSHSNRVLSLPKTEHFSKDSSGVYQSGGHIFHAHRQPIHNNPNWQIGIDAIVTDKSDVFPVIMSADCAAIGLFDTQNNVFALAHVGLIGAINEIVTNVIHCMMSEYKSDPTKIEIVMFPSIRKCHYDLKISGAWERIKQDSINYYGESNPIFFDNMFDLQGLITYQLINTGVKIDLIHDTKMCTVCDNNLFFSNLAAGNPQAKMDEGRFASIMGMINER